MIEVCADGQHWKQINSCDRTITEPISTTDPGAGITSAISILMVRRIVQGAIKGRSGANDQGWVRPQLHLDK